MTGRQKLATVLTTATIGIGTLGVGGAAAAHCTAPGDHAQATAGDQDHNEGEHQGWSTCVEQSNSDNDTNNRDNDNRGPKR